MLEVSQAGLGVGWHTGREGTLPPVCSEHRLSPGGASSLGAFSLPPRVGVQLLQPKQSTEQGWGGGGWWGDREVAPVTSGHSREPSPTVLPGDRVWFLLPHALLWKGQSKHVGRKDTDLMVMR